MSAPVACDQFQITAYQKISARVRPQGKTFALANHLMNSIDAAALLIEGRVLETVLKAERGVASRGCGS
jgi:hypothetical protein